MHKPVHSQATAHFKPLVHTMAVNIPLAKANHRAEPKVKVKGNYHTYMMKGMDTGKGEDSGQ